MIPQLGQIARVRSRQYLVEEVTLPPAPGQDTLVRLSCLDDDAQGKSLEVLWETELDAEVVGDLSWSAVASRGFDAPGRFAAYLHTLRWGCVSSTDPRLFQSPYRAGIQVNPYQLEPLRKALSLPRVNLFIADDVGLGKTIEAGLIVRELLLRQRIHRLVVACPPSVVTQWQAELESRFGLTTVIFDRAYVQRCRRQRGYGVNPWSTHTRFIVSQALLRDEGYASTLRDWLGPAEPCPGSLLILDEAHHAAPASGSKYAIDSQLTHVVRELAPHFEHRLFLSATPHNGHSNSFSALLEILDPQRFCRGVKVQAKQLDAVMVRRLKSDLREAQIDDSFPDRKVIQIDLDGLPPDAPELLLGELLAEYRALRELQATEALASKTKRAAGLLVITSLQKRLLSSIEAFAVTLHVHRRSLERRRAQTAPVVDERQLSLLAQAPGADDAEAELSADELAAEEAAQVELATQIGMGVSGDPPPDLPRAAGEEPGVRASETQLSMGAIANPVSAPRAVPLHRAAGEGGVGGLDPAPDLPAATALLDQMTRLAEAHRRLPDPRVLALVAWLRAHCCPGTPGRWNERRVLIFTEYQDTLRYLEQQLAEALSDTDDIDLRLATFAGTGSGSGNDPHRDELKRAFNAAPKDHPLRVLLATDAAREGVNLQNHCADLFHFDVPWNPSRLEQRNGRLDRKLQREPEVRCHYFVLTQRPEDRVLAALVAKSATIQKELGSLSQVLEDRLTRAFAGGLSPHSYPSLVAALQSTTASEAPVLEAELEGTRERQHALTLQVENLRKYLKRSEDDLDFHVPQFHAALDEALALLDAPALTPGADGQWRFPDLATDPSWAVTLDTLRKPRPPDVTFWDWRRTFPPRPVVFKDVGSLDDDAVHLHLEHRVVQRLLARFTAQGFVSHDLSRATAVLSDDPLPRVVLIGRLSLYGDRASRLHDELVLVTAAWTDPETRKSPLRAYGDKGHTTTLALLDAALGPGAEAPPAARQKHLAAAVAGDVAALAAVLQARGDELAHAAEGLLAKRGEREAADMRELLTAQRKRISEALARDDAQLQLEFAAQLDAKRQLEAERRAQSQRLAAIERELVAEPARILAGYQVRATRLDPVGVVYLWPRSG